MSSANKFQWPTVVTGLRGITWAGLPSEISAGITLAALIIPLNIGYAQVAGLPPVFGLYAGIIPLIIFTLFTGSRHLIGSPDASSSAIVGAFLIGFAQVGDPMRIQYALALALMCGLLFFVFWLFRLAFLANFLSKAVLTGFISGLGIEVLTNQVRKMLGAAHTSGAELEPIAQYIHEAMATSVNTTGYFVELVALVESIPHVNFYSAAIGFGTIIIVRLMKRYTPKVPAALVTLILMTVTVIIFGLDKKGVGVLGSMPSGLPTLMIPNIPMQDYLRLLPGAVAVVAITLCEGLLLVRSSSNKYNTKADGNQVLFAFGAANIAGGLTGSLVTGTSASRTAAMGTAGSRTQFSSLVAAVTVALVMLFFTKQLAYLPAAALAGIVANAVLNLIEIKEIRRLWHIRRSEFWVAFLCLFSVLVFGPLQAVIIAFLFATIDLLRRSSRPRTWVLQESLDCSHFVTEINEEKGHALDTSGIIIYRFDAPLYFANAVYFQNEVENLVKKAATPVKRFVLDTQAMVDIDTTGEETLRHILTWLIKRDVTVALSRTNQLTIALLSRYQLLNLIDKNRLYPTNRHAIKAFRKEIGQDKI